MRWIPCLAVAAAIQVPGVVYSQEVGVSGWLDRVDQANSTISIRSLGGNRTVSVAPNAVVRLNGAVVRLDQLPANSSISITTQKDPNGVLRASEISATSGPSGTHTPQPSAAAPVGSLIRGTLVGLDVPNNSLTLRTISGDHKIPLGTAPIIMSGLRASTRNLRVGQMIQVERGLPTEASQDFVTQMVRILPSQSANVQTRAASSSSAIRSRTRGSRSTYRAKARTSRSKSRQTRRPQQKRTKTQALRPTVWKGIAFQPLITFPGEGVTDQQAVLTDTGTQRTPTRVTGPPAMAGSAASAAATHAGPGAAAVTPGAAAVAPDGTVVVPGATVVSPGTIVVSPGPVVTSPITPDTTGATAPGATGVVGTAPQTTIPDARTQAATGAAVGGAGVVDRGTALSAPTATVVDPRLQSVPQAGVADPRAQSLGTPGAVPPAVADPRNQGVVAPGVVAPGAVAAPANVPNPRNQGVVTPGAILPGAAAPPVGVPDPRFQSPAAPGIIRPGVVSPVFPAPARRPLLRPMRPGVVQPRITTPATPAPAAPR